MYALLTRVAASSTVINDVPVRLRCRLHKLYDTNLQNNFYFISLSRKQYTLCFVFT